MSEYWDVYCRTCGKQFGEFDARAQLGIKDANHRQDMICALIRLAPAFIAFNAALRVEPLAEIGVTYGYADRSLNLRWFEEHAGHELVCAGNGDLFAGCFYAIALMEQRHGGNRSIEELLDFAIESLTECCASKCDFA